MQVDKGALFDIGEALTLKELDKAEPQNAELAARLFLAHCVAEVTPEIVAQIEAEIAFDASREARHSEADAVAKTRGANADLMDALNRLAALQPKAAPVRAR